MEYTSGKQPEKFIEMHHSTGYNIREGKVNMQ